MIIRFPFGTILWDCGWRPT